MQFLPIRHVLDMMHIERNISNNFLRHLFGEKDTPAVQRDMEAIGKVEHLHLQQQAGSVNFVQPRAPYVFLASKKEEFLALIAGTQVPTGYSSTLIKHAGQNQLAGLKSHDHHCLIQQILPAAVRNMLDPGVRETNFEVGELVPAYMRLRH